MISDIYDLYDLFDQFDHLALFLRFFATSQFLFSLCGKISENLF